MMRKVLILCLLLFILTGCASEVASTETPTLDATVLNATAVSQATVDALATQDALSLTETHAPSATWTPAPTLDRTRPLIQTPTSEIPCNKAAAGSPIDVTIPDGTVLAPGEPFTKTWRLQNVGSCTWTRLYAVTFFSGNSFKAFQTKNLPQEVKPGEVIDITVDMEAPSKLGIYQSNWMLSDPQGVLFGIGPNGDAPFWAQIEVVTAVTPTPSVTVTRTPVVSKTGGAALGNGDKLDLDSGSLNPSDVTQADFSYQYGGDPDHILLTMNGTRWLVMDETEPGFGACLNATLKGNAISFDVVPGGTYVCYQTSDALPGWLLIEGFSGGKLAVSFLTWAAP